MKTYTRHAVFSVGISNIVLQERYVQRRRRFEYREDGEGSRSGAFVV